MVVVITIIVAVVVTVYLIVGFLNRVVYTASLSAPTAGCAAWLEARRLAAQRAAPPSA